MSFEQLIKKVTQAEDALEAHERRVAADLRRMKASWLAAWTPGRIIIAGLVSGFLVGRAQPVRLAAQSGQWLQWVSALSGLFASGSAQVAASNAAAAADQAGDVAQAVAPSPDDAAIADRLRGAGEATASLYES